MKRLIIAMAAALTLSACETATPYQPFVPGSQTSGGYREVRVEANRWRVTFSGNSLTGRETVENYLLYRSAELTMAQGYDWFALADRYTNRDTRTYVDPPIGGYGYGGYYGRFGGFWGPSWRYYGARGWNSWGPWGPDPFFDVHTVTRYEATAEIVMGRGPKPEGDRRAFDARGVLDNLGTKIVRPAI